MKIDLGCGKNKRKDGDWIGCDQYAMEGVDKVFNIGAEKWPFEDNSIDEAHAAHFIEHLTNREGKWERVHFFNELHRVLKPGAKATVIFPHWNSTRFYGDPTHCEPFSEFGFYYLSQEWRKTQAPHTDKEWNPNGLSCDLQAVWGNAPHPELANRNQEYAMFAMQWFKEAIQDLHVTLTKPAPKVDD